MNTTAIKVFNPVWNMDVTMFVRDIDGVELADGHVEALKEDLYSAISDASKDAYGTRTRIDISEKTVAELEELCDFYFKAASIAADEEAAAQDRAVEKFEANIANIIANGAGDRETAIRWFRDANADDMYGDESVRWKLGLPWDYDFDHGDRNLFARKAEDEWLASKVAA